MRNVAFVYLIKPIPRAFLVAHRLIVTATMNQSVSFQLSQLQTSDQLPCQLYVPVATWFNTSFKEFQRKHVPYRYLVCWFLDLITASMNASRQPALVTVLYSCHGFCANTHWSTAHGSSSAKAELLVWLQDFANNHVLQTGMVSQNPDENKLA